MDKLFIHSVKQSVKGNVFLVIKDIAPAKDDFFGDDLKTKSDKTGTIWLANSDLDTARAKYKIGTQLPKRFQFGEQAQEEETGKLIPGVYAIEAVQETPKEA